MNEPLITESKTGIGRPEYTDEQYQLWLDEISTFLKMGNSLYYSCNKSGIVSHYWSILKKYKANDWFSQKVDAYRAMPGEIVNNVFVTLLNKVSEKVKNEKTIDRDDISIIKFMAEKHRTAQPFFVTRTEEAKADDSKLGKIIEALDEGTDYDNLAREAEKQVVAANAPLQDQEQARSTSDIQAESDAAQASSGSQESPAQ